MAFHIDTWELIARYQMVIVQSLKIGEQSEGRRNSSWELVWEQVAIHQTIKSAISSQWTKKGLAMSNSKSNMNLVQSLKTGEWSNGRRNGSWQLIREQLAAHQTIESATNEREWLRNDGLQQISPQLFSGDTPLGMRGDGSRTGLEDWWEIQWSMEWFLRADCLPSRYYQQRITIISFSILRLTASQMSPGRFITLIITLPVEYEK